MGGEMYQQSRQLTLRLACVLSDAEATANQQSKGSLLRCMGHPGLQVITRGCTQLLINRASA
jgi:hypothetical protein